MSTNRFTHTAIDADIERAPSAADIEYDDRRQIIGWGLTLAPTPHRFTVAGRRLYCWCAADTLLFPPIIGRTAGVQSQCPATGQTIRLIVHPDAGITEVDPPGAVITVPGPDEVDAGRVRATTCNPGRFFASADAASDWQAQHPSGSVLPVANAYDQFRLGAERMVRSSEHASMTAASRIPGGVIREFCSFPGHGERPGTGSDTSLQTSADV